MTIPEYEVLAIKYAQREARRAEHFVGGDPHDAPMPMDYFIWLIRGHGREIVIDTGFTADMATKRGRQFLRAPRVALGLLGVKAEAVREVVITHMHYDHMETGRCFPTTFHLGRVVEGYETLRRLAESPRHVIPGHDPLVMTRYPAVSKDLEGIAVRLDVMPHEQR